MTTYPAAEKPLNPLLWLWIPLMWAAIQGLMELTLNTNLLITIHSEYGPHELLQFLMVAIGAVIAYSTLYRMDRRANPWLTFWIALAAVCCTYVAIEEISWGQTFIKWSTPEFWAQVNVQEETNLHNTSSWLNQKPRILLAIGVAIGGLIIPLLQKYKPSWVPAKFAIIYPPATLSVVAAIFLFVRLSEKTANSIFDMDIYARPSEIEELYLFYFVMLYIVVMRQRLSVNKNQEKTA